jgi:hypothetical protein
LLFVMGISVAEWQAYRSLGHKTPFDSYLARPVNGYPVS